MTRPPYVVDFQRLERVARYVDPLSPTERRTFVFIARNPGTQASVIAEAENLSADAASRAFKKLATLRLVRAERDADDRRVARYGMTKKGYDELLKWASKALGQEVREITAVAVWDRNADETDA